MDNLTAIFDEAIHLFGYGAVFSPIPSEISPYFEVERVRAHHAIELATSDDAIVGMPPIYFDFVDNSTLNAVAFNYKDHDFIGVYNGTTFLLRDTFGRMMSHPHVFPDIGDVKGETIRDWHREGIGSNFFDFVIPRLRRGEVGTFVAKSPIRDYFARFCARIAGEFIVTHEIAHISHGHLRYVAEVTGAAKLLEISDDKSPEMKPLTRQAIEMDADASACERTLKSIMLWGSLAGQLPPELADTSRIIPDVRQALFIWAYAVAGLFYLWGIKLQGTNPADSPYPPTAIRLMMVLGTAEAVLEAGNQKGIHSIPMEQFRTIAGNAIAALHINLTHIGWSDWLASQEALNLVVTRPDLVAHFTRISEEWTRIRPDLFRYSYFQRLAP